VCGCASAPAGADGPQAGALGRAVEDWQAGWQGEGRVVVGNFVDAEHGSGSAFGRYLQEEVSRLLAAGGARPVDRRELEAKLVSAETSLEHLVGATRGVGGVRRLKEEDAPTKSVHGDYQVVGDEVEVHLQLSDALSSALEEKTVRLPLEQARRQGALLPENHERSQRAQESLSEEEPREFGLELWVDRGAGGAYELGATLQILVRSERDCYLKIVHVASDGSLQLVFPNRYERDNLLAAKKVHRIGGPDYAFQLTVSEPVGEESLFAYASTRQFDDVEQVLAAARRDVVALGKADAEGIRAFRARGLKISPRTEDASGGSQPAEAPLRSFASTRYVVLAPEGE
jgi:hypothetical protein